MPVLNANISVPMYKKTNNKKQYNKSLQINEKTFKRREIRWNLKTTNFFRQQQFLWCKDT